MLENPRLAIVRHAILNNAEAFRSWHARHGNPGGWNRHSLTWCTQGFIKAFEGTPVAANLASTRELEGCFRLGWMLGDDLADSGPPAGCVADSETPLLTLRDALATARAPYFAWLNFPRSGRGSVEHMEAYALVHQWFFGCRESMVMGDTVSAMAALAGVTRGGFRVIDGGAW